ncbi:MAG TPA: SusC/RagA family TonB-linked outer membrane protein [Gemmatimonadaceae bacterium]|nr:SusC/RagA family TonB-linked outer membrane protein [Gemmatimonadaceae bacterium]
MGIARFARPASLILMAGALCLAGTAAWAQGTVTGHVTARSDSQPIAGVRVLALGTNAAANTAQDGKYTLIGVRAGSVEVEVLRIGYQPLKRTVTVTNGGTTNLDFQLAAAPVMLNEVVTTATGEQRRIELGSAVSTLGNVSERVEQTSITNMSDLLVAKVPGMTVIPGAFTNGAPNIHIRGLNSLSLNNSPIFVIDGVRMNVGGSSSNGGNLTAAISVLNDIDASTIEDVEVVKGPSAATLYGTDAANGVILITTKKGKVGRNRWTFSAEQGSISDKSNYLTAYMIWGHAPGSTAAIRCYTYTISAGSCIADSTSSLNILKDKTGLSPLATGYRNQWNLQVSGGTEAVRYFVSGGLENETGPEKMPGFSVQRLDSVAGGVRSEWNRPEYYQKLNLNTNLSTRLSPAFDVDVTAGFSKVDEGLPQSNNNTFSPTYQSMMGPGFRTAGPGYTGIGNLGEALNGYNSYVPSEIFRDVNQNASQRLIGSLHASWRPLAWMQNDGSAGVDWNNRTGIFLCRFGECPAAGTLRLGATSSTTTNDRVFSMKVISTSTWQAKPWMSLKTTFGSDYTNVENDGTSASGTQLPPGAQSVGQAAVTAASNVLWTATKTWGYYAQEQVALRDRLFVTGAVRADENSAFGTNFKKVVYPKLSVSWLLSDEPFFPKIRGLDQLRLRGAYGASGVQPGATSALITYSSTTVNQPVVAVNQSGTDTPGLRQSALGNPNLKPELSVETEVGFEARALGDRMNIDVTYYNKHTRDALISQVIAPSVGPASTTVLRNLGSVQNTGIEATIQATLVNTQRFGWDVTASASHSGNKLVSLGLDPTGVPNKTIGTGSIRDSVGLPINAFFYRAHHYNDANRDGFITPNEVTVDPNVSFRGYSSPRDLASVANGFDLFSHRVRINSLFDYKGGGMIVNTNLSFQCSSTPKPCADVSTVNSPLARQAAAIALIGPFTNGQSTTAVGYLEPLQYWRFRELSATVFLPQRVVKNWLRGETGTVTFAARNLHTWTNYRGIDVEENGIPIFAFSNDVQNTTFSQGSRRYYTVKLSLHY